MEIKHVNKYKYEKLKYLKEFQFFHKKTGNLY